MCWSPAPEPVPPARTFPTPVQARGARGALWEPHGLARQGHRLSGQNSRGKQTQHFYLRLGQRKPVTNPLFSSVPSIDRADLFVASCGVAPPHHPDSPALATLLLQLGGDLHLHASHFSLSNLINLGEGSCHSKKKKNFHQHYLCLSELPDLPPASLAPTSHFSFSLSLSPPSLLSLSFFLPVVYKGFIMFSTNQKGLLIHN